MITTVGIPSKFTDSITFVIAPFADVNLGTAMRFGTSSIVGSVTTSVVVLPARTSDGWSKE